VTGSRKVGAQVDVGPVTVDVDWGDGTVARGVRGRLYHEYEAGATVEVTVTDPASGLSAAQTVHVPAVAEPARPPAPPQVSFDQGGGPPPAHTSKGKGKGKGAADDSAH
jgi:hypothetical protein